jgi:protein TonB
MSSHIFIFMNSDNTIFHKPMTKGIAFSLFCHIFFFTLLIVSTKMFYKSKEFKRPVTFELVKLQQIYEIPENPSLARAPKEAAAPKIAKEQPQQQVQEPVPQQEQTPVPTDKPVAEPAPQQAAPVAASATVSMATNTTTGTPGGTGVNTNTIYESGMVDQVPRKLHTPEPFYPEFVKEQGIQGTVKAQVVIDTNGSVIEIKIVSSPSELLSDEVLKTVGRWKYVPGKYKGVPVKVKDRNVEIKFELTE